MLARVRTYRNVKSQVEEGMSNPRFGNGELPPYGILRVPARHMAQGLEGRQTDRHDALQISVSLKAG